MLLIEVLQHEASLHVLLRISQLLHSVDFVDTPGPFTVEVVDEVLVSHRDLDVVRQGLEAAHVYSAQVALPEHHEGRAWREGNQLVIIF